MSFTAHKQEGPIVLAHTSYHACHFGECLPHSSPCTPRLGPQPSLSLLTSQMAHLATPASPAMGLQAVLSVHLALQSPSYCSAEPSCRSVTGSTSLLPAGPGPKCQTILLTSHCFVFQFRNLMYTSGIMQLYGLTLISVLMHCCFTRSGPSHRVHFSWSPAVVLLALTPRAHMSSLAYAVLLHCSLFFRCF